MNLQFLLPLVYTFLEIQIPIISVIFHQNNVDERMEGEFQCTKIKDGLYLGTLATTQDYQFLQINKFSYIINCSAEIPNYFDNHGIKYLKFKLIKERTHKLWDENLKKLKKLEKFIEEAEEQSLCCIIFSANGNNRSLVMLSAFLMSKYRWTLDKTLAYIRSKNVFIGLSENYIAQLETLQTILNDELDKPKLTSEWKGPFNNDEEEIISKTYINSQEIPLFDLEKREKKEKRVTWQDKIDKEKKKEKESREGKEGKLKQTGVEQFKKVRSNYKFIEECPNPAPSLSTKILRKELVQSPLKKSDNLKKPKKPKNISISKVQTAGELKKVQNYEQFQQNQKQQQKQAVPGENKYFSEKELIKLIKKNLKIKKEDKEEEIQQDKENQPEKGVYRLTINNFISPNINIMNSLPLDKNQKANKSLKAVKKEDKNARAQSEKEPGKANNDSLKTRAEKAGKTYKRVTENSPKMREKKLEKATSLQFKRNN